MRKARGQRLIPSRLTMAMPSTNKWWRWVLVLAGATAVIRTVVLMLSPIELAGDEAQYWDWSRHLDLSYYSKGPGVAWTIAGSTRLLGDAEWAVRLPAVIAGVVLILATAALARAMNGKASAAFFAACLIALLPAYQVIALVMTIDGPYVASWAMAAWCGWIAADRMRAQRAWIGWGLACAVALGVGFLYKYTVLLLVPGLLAWAWMNAPRSRKPVLGLLACTAVFACVISPVIIWNAREGWPTVAHLLGHLGAKGGDLAQKASEPWRYNPLWTLEFFGAQLGMVGPMVGLMVMSMRSRRSAGDEVTRRAVVFTAWTALPILVFYFFTSFITDVEGNWPIAGYVTLVAMSGAWLAGRGAKEVPPSNSLPEGGGAEPSRDRGHVSPARTLPEGGGLRRAILHWTIGYGVVAGVAMLMLPIIAKLPMVGGLVPMHRLSGHRALAMQAQQVIDSVREQSGMAPVIASDRYERAALLAYYLPSKPAVCSAASLMGDRRSSYDFFPDTNLRDPALVGRPMVMIGGGERKWKRALAFDSWVDAPTVGEGRQALPVRIGLGYRGPADTPDDSSTDADDDSIAR